MNDLCNEFCDVFNSISLLFEGELKVGEKIEGKPFEYDE